MKNGPKPKKINFQLIPKTNAAYDILEEVRSEYHEELEHAKIALAWRKTTKPDVDGRLVLGRCVKSSDLQRELVDWDFVIVLNREVWENDEFTLKKKEALIDHELCHAARAVDKDGEDKEDEKGRPVWRVRKHDIEEFREVVQRHGCYKKDLEDFAKALVGSKQRDLQLAAAK
jgi:hypothetical protein